MARRRSICFGHCTRDDSMHEARIRITTTCTWVSQPPLVPCPALHGTEQVGNRGKCQTQGGIYLGLVLRYCNPQFKICHYKTRLGCPTVTFPKAGNDDATGRDTQHTIFAKHQPPKGGCTIKHTISESNEKDSDTKSRRLTPFDLTDSTIILRGCSERSRHTPFFFFIRFDDCK